jgi:P-type Cu+ transporter
VIDGILQEVEGSIHSSQSRRQLQAEQWMHTFVGIVTCAAVLTFAGWTWLEGFSSGWFRSMSVLLIACPCALGIATPLAIWTGLWQLSSLGLVSRASTLMDALAHTRHLFFDKTGTLTHHALQLGPIRITPNCPFSKDALLAIAATLEAPVEHPIAHAFALMPGANATLPTGLDILQQRWIPGRGIEATVQLFGKQQHLRLGTPDWADSTHADQTAAATDASTKRVRLSLEGQTLADFELIEDLRPGVTTLIRQLQALGIRSSILTGDPFPRWRKVDCAVVRENLSPDDKAALVTHSAQQGESPIFVGDGINDLNAMLSAAASIAIHQGGASLTQSNASAILTSDNLLPIASAIRLARRIDETLRSNMRIAITYNAIGMSLAALGFLHPVASALIMVLSSLIVTFRAIRRAEAMRVN